MKKLSIFFLLAMNVQAHIYYAQAQPLEMLLIKSHHAGTIVHADVSIEGRIAGTKALIELDTTLDTAELVTVRKKLPTQEALVQTNQSVYTKRLAYYESIQALKNKSQIDIDNAFYAQASAHEHAVVTQNSWYDLLQLEKVLIKRIEEKKVRFPGWYVYKLHVKAGDVVTVGTPLVEVANVSQAKLQLFLTREDALHVHEMDVYLNGEATSYQITTSWNVADATHVSSYEAHLYIDAPLQFSTIMTVELKPKERP